MARNVEIKARVNNRNALLQKILTLTNQQPEILEQTDTFFNTPQGRLKLREFSDRPAELIYYERPDGSAPKTSNYSRCPVNNTAQLKQTLAQAWGVRGVVEKNRWLYIIGQTRVHVDQVKNLGHFMELEVVMRDEQTIDEGTAIARELLKQLEIKDNTLLARAYIDMLEMQDTTNTEIIHHAESQWFPHKG